MPGQCMLTSETSLHSLKKAREENVDDDFEAYLARMAMAETGAENENQNNIDNDSVFAKFQSSLSSEAPDVIKETLKQTDARDFKKTFETRPSFFNVIN